MTRNRSCWICALPGGGHGGPVFWFQHWHIRRLARDGKVGHWLRSVRITMRGTYE